MRRSGVRFIFPAPLIAKAIIIDGLFLFVNGIAMGLRVLHIGKFFPPHHGGMEVFLADLVAEQRAQGLEASVLVHGNSQPEDPPWLVRVPVQAHLVYAPIALGFRSALDRAIQSFKPQVLHLHMPNNAVFWCLTLASARAVPWVVHWHSDVVVSEKRTALSFAYVAYRPFEQAVLRAAHKIIVTSPPYLAASQPLQDWQDKCVVVPLGLAPLVTSENDKAIAVGWTSDERVLRLLSIGRLAHYKGFETLIRAAASLPNVQLLIVGDGESRADLLALISELETPGTKGNVQLVGAVDNSQKRALLASCDLFCLASNERTEAFGVVLLEAMQFARPCLVTALEGSGMPWLVQTARAGVLCNLNDISHWQTCIQALHDDSVGRSTLGQAGLHAVNTRFTSRAVCKSISAQYEVALAPLQAPVEKQHALIVIPARNEAQTIGELLGQLQAVGWTEVLVVDDHSTDGTGDIARAAGAHVLRPVLPLGAWGGMQTGIRYALAQGYNAVITMDADGQHEVEQLPKLLAAGPKADLVIGAFPERASHLRRLAWAWFRRIAGFELRDLTSGFRFYNRAAMTVAASSEATLLDYQDLGTLLLMRQAGLQIHEVPVSMQLRVNGKSRIFNSWFNVMRYMVATSLLCLTLR